MEIFRGHLIPQAEAIAKKLVDLDMPHLDRITGPLSRSRSSRGSSCFLIVFLGFVSFFLDFLLFYKGH